MAMTVLEALAILEAAVLECKKRDVDTPEVTDALNLLEPYIRRNGWYRSFAAISNALRMFMLRWLKKVNSKCFALLSLVSEIQSAFFSKCEWTDSPLNS
jgi:hypothetical protein